MNTKIDYSAPILFIPAGVQTTPSKQAAAQKKPTPVQKKATPAAPKKPAVATSIAPIKNKITEVKPVPKPEITPEIRKAEEKPTPKPEPIKEIPPIAQITEPIKPTPPPIQAEPIAQAQPVIPHNATISHDYREVESLRRAAQLQKELIKNWKAPIGVPKDCACEISITVTPNGTIKNLKMVKNSGILMYDISARQAIFSMTMPQWTHGKTITVNFKQ